MTLDNALAALNQTSKIMSAQYGRPVFDEWAIIQLSRQRGKILSYSGSRRTEFQEKFPDDVASLKSSLLSANHHVGDFDFARAAAGTAFDAFIAAGRDVYLICNNTSLSMDAITQDPRWLQAQVSFAELADTFRQDPLLVEA